MSLERGLRSVTSATRSRIGDAASVANQFSPLTLLTRLYRALGFPLGRRNSDPFGDRDGRNVVESAKVQV
jgi:hypothetical protein